MSIDAAVPESDAPSEVSRRGLIRNAAGAGAAGLAAGVLLTAGAGPAQAAEPRTVEPRAAKPAANEHTPEHTETLIVHVRDARTGELEIYHGKAHRIVHDRKLTNALLHAAG